MGNAPQSKTALFRPGSWWETRRIGEVLREETIGGALLLAAAVVALAWANSPWSAAYESLRTLTVGPTAWHLHLDLATWAADGLLAVFFFVAGLELKREFAAGDLRDPRRAAVPVAAAVGGVIVPALIYAAFTAGAGGGAIKGWAIPGATDIAFALAVLAVAGRHLPSALRTFLLTLAVVDDLLAIVIIAVFYTSGLSVLPLVMALVPLAAFAVLLRRHRPGSWWLLLPLAAVTWALVHASGVHATVAGVLLAFTVPVLRRAGRDGPGTAAGPAGHFEHRLRPVSAGLAVPVFALLSAGVSLGGLSGLRTALSDPVALGTVAGLVAGKTVGIFAATWLVARFTRATLDEGLSWTDMAGVAMLGGVGFTVSLLISELAFGTGGGREDHAKVAVLTGSLIAALLASIVLRLRNRAYRRIEAAESPGADRDGIPGAREAGLGHREPAGSQATRSPGTTARAIASAEQARRTPDPPQQPSGSNGRRAAEGRACGRAPAEPAVPQIVAAGEFTAPRKLLFRAAVSPWPCLKPGRCVPGRRPHSAARATIQLSKGTTRGDKMLLSGRNLADAGASREPRAADTRPAHTIGADPGKLFTSGLSASEYVLLGEAGFESLGFVTGSSVYHVGLQAARWSRSHELQAIGQAMHDARHLAIARMRAEADRLGADGIAGVRLCMERHAWGRQMLEFTATGTAVKAARGTRAYRAPGGNAFTSDLSAQDFSRLLAAGAVPVTFVLGTCVYHIAPQMAVQALRQAGPNQEMIPFTQSICEARELALARMRAESADAKASGIIGVSVAVSSHFWGVHATEFLATGTAIRRLGEGHRVPAASPSRPAP